MLRAFIFLAAMLLVSSSSAWALGGSGSVVVDIVGSKTDNTNVMSSGTDKVELEVIGSEAINTTIGSPEKKDFHRHSCCDDGNEEKDRYTDYDEDQGGDNPWDGMHLGVDAWYNTFWYRDEINTPKWPQF